ncbi:MAG: type II secretion system protein [Candidatus Gracilibacteria bacterium]|nr:type II secretion system protein [Candidatus Gracilibacteria bacterium]
MPTPNTKNNKTSHTIISPKNFLGFTLIELIVVITILVILGTIAFVNLGGFQSSARDSSRVSDLTNITKGLEMLLVRNGSVVPPESPVGGGLLTLTASGGSIIGYQGVVGSNVLSVIKMSTTQDPLDKKYYTYVTNGANTRYQVLALMEDASTTAFVPLSSEGERRGMRDGNILGGDKENIFIDTAFAGYETRTPAMKGYALGVLLASSGSLLNQPIQELISGNTSLDIQNFSGSLGGTAIGPLASYFSKSDSILPTSTGSILATALQISMNNGGNGFNAPSTCPSGFVPVPGNKEFNQPGFCVSKYAMTYGDADVPNSCNSSGAILCTPTPPAENTSSMTNWNTVAYMTGKSIASLPNKFPIANITQSQAIVACQSMGVGYHLITNNEWMTIARDIEAQGDNWSTGIIGSGGIYRGITVEGNSLTSLGCKTVDSNGSGSRTYATKPLATDTTKFGTAKGMDCDSKRQYRLSNGKIIWDMSGNVWSHVNKGNTVDGSMFNDASSLVSNACNGVNDWQAFSTGATADGVNTCNYVNGYSYANIGPKTPNLNSNNGIGRIFPFNIPNNVFFRGGDASHGPGAGIFTIHLDWHANSTTRFVGFRCTR